MIYQILLFFKAYNRIYINCCPNLDEIRIFCDFLENVDLPYSFCCIVDESGKIKEKPQPLNPLASRFYPGSKYGDFLVGPVVFCRIDLVDGEPDWCPLLDHQIGIIELITGKTVPLLDLALCK